MWLVEYADYIASCLVLGLELGLWLGLDIVCDLLVVMHTYFYYFRLSLSLSHAQLLTVFFAVDHSRGVGVVRARGVT